MVPRFETTRRHSAVYSRQARRSGHLKENLAQYMFPDNTFYWLICGNLKAQGYQYDINAPSIMNIKRIFGSVLTILGIVGLIYGAILFVNTSGGNRDVRALVTYGILGLIFLISGLGLVRATKDQS
jgi:hypothetical protein